LGPPRERARNAHARPGSKRDALLKLIEESEGLTRGEILEKMAFKGNKAGEMSVSNALTALTKANQVVRADGRYRVAQTILPVMAASIMDFGRYSQRCRAAQEADRNCLPGA
jgi:hypothetical protein